MGIEEQDQIFWLFGCICAYSVSSAEVMFQPLRWDRVFIAPAENWPQNCSHHWKQLTPNNARYDGQKICTIFSSASAARVAQTHQVEIVLEVIFSIWQLRRYKAHQKSGNPWRLKALTVTPSHVHMWESLQENITRRSNVLTGNWFLDKLREKVKSTKQKHVILDILKRSFSSK